MDVWQVVIIFLEDSDKVVVEYGNGDFRPGLLLCQRDNTHPVMETHITLRDMGIV